MTDSAVLPGSDQVAVMLKGGRVTVLRDRWNEHANEWIAWVRAPGNPDSYGRFHRKHFMELVPEAGRLTLDIGCGEGRVARDLQADGHKVLGVDWSPAMCQAAATHPDKPMRVVVGDAAKLPLPDAAADCVVAFMSLQDIDDLAGALKEIARVLDDEKKLALAIVHPMYSTGKFSPTENSNVDFVVKRSYFQSRLCISEHSHGDLKITFFREHRPLATYVQALLSAGFYIEQLLEVTDDDEGSARHRVPMFLDILATRRPREKEVGWPNRPGIISRLPGCSILARSRGAGNLELLRRGRSYSRLVSPIAFSGVVLFGLLAAAAIAFFTAY